MSLNVSGRNNIAASFPQIVICRQLIMQKTPTYVGSGGRYICVSNHLVPRDLQPRTCYKEVSKFIGQDSING